LLEVSTGVYGVGTASASDIGFGEFADASDIALSLLNVISYISDSNPLTEYNNDSVTTALVRYRKDSATDFSAKDSKPCAKPVVNACDDFIIGSMLSHSQFLTINLILIIQILAFFWMSGFYL
jgi:hypothetical protein